MYEMGCKLCEKAQEEGEYVSYVRIGTGNVMVIGCMEHLGELMRMVTKNIENENKV